MVLNQRHLEKRDTMTDYWFRRINDMQLRDDPVGESSSSITQRGAALG